MFLKYFKKTIIWIIALIFCGDIFYNFVNGTAVMGNDAKDLLLTASERAALDEFKRKVINRLPEQFMKTDFYLLRWLRAKKLNQEAAQQMLFENVQWRKQNNISSIGCEDFSVIDEDYQLSIGGHDKQFRPIGTIDFGKWDLRAAAFQGNLHRLSRYTDYLLEGTFQKVLEAQDEGKNVTRCRFLVDADRLTMLQTLCGSCVPFIFKLINGLEAHYPSFLEEITVINAPPVVSVGLNAIRPVMSKQNRDSIKVFSSDKDKWMAYLDERIDRDQRTKVYGGTMEPSKH